MNYTEYQKNCHVFLLLNGRLFDIACLLNKFVELFVNMQVTVDQRVPLILTNVSVNRVRMEGHALIQLMDLRASVLKV
jgi:hypothetical protein